MTEQQAMAALHWPGWLEVGEADVAADVAEYGWTEWPPQRQEWTWMRDLCPNIHGELINLGPVRDES
jgi:hypothetical protein